MELDLRLPGGVAAASAARHAFDGLGGFADQETLEDLRLLVAQVVSSSVFRRDPRSRSPIDVHVATSREALRVEISDPGTNLADLVAPELGRGHSLAGLADRCGIVLGDSSRIWFEVDSDSRGD
jgi:hypothetical protein